MDLIYINKIYICLSDSPEIVPTPGQNHFTLEVHPRIGESLILSPVTVTNPFNSIKMYKIDNIIHEGNGVVTYLMLS